MQLVNCCIQLFKACFDATDQSTEVQSTAKPRLMTLKPKYGALKVPFHGHSSQAEYSTMPYPTLLHITVTRIRLELPEW